MNPGVERDLMIAEFRVLALVVLAIVTIVWVIVGIGAFGLPARAAAAAARPPRPVGPARPVRQPWVVAPVPRSVRRARHRRLSPVGAIAIALLIPLAWLVGVAIDVLQASQAGES